MKMKRWIRKIVPILSAMLLAWSMCICAHADGNIDPNGDYSLTITLSEEDDIPIGSATYEIYKVQQWTDKGKDQDLAWVGIFSQCGISSFRSINASLQLSHANTLLKFVEENKIQPTDTRSTVEGATKITFSNLRPGVYLVVVSSQPENYTLVSPFLAFVPFVNQDGTINDDNGMNTKVGLKGVPKPTEAPTPTPTPTATPQPTKTPRPTNPPTPQPTRTPQPTNPPTPQPTRTPQPTSTPVPGSTPAPTSTPGSTPEPTQPPTPAPTINRPAPTPTPDQAVLGMRRRKGFENGVLGKRRLPQTGTLQWPIPVLAVAGILLFLAGWMRKYGKKNKTEDGKDIVKKKKGMLLMSVGPLLIIGGMGVLFYNNWDNTRAEKAAEEVLVQIEQQSVEKEETEVIEPEAEEVEEEIDTTMGLVEVDGFSYIGEVIIPAFDINLPVMNSVTSEGLKIAPGRYEGNYKENSLIIAAHNYQRHFGNIKYLSPGDEVIFADVDGTEYYYEVSEVETVGGKKVEKMSEGDWDLTLFTCTYGGRNRVTVRCNLQEEI